MSRKTKKAGSTVSKDQKTEPIQKTTVRRIQDITRWFEPQRDLKGSKLFFEVGILRDVVFDPKAPVMRDVFCGTKRVSEATATGILQTERVFMPEDATVTCKVDYDTERKVFHERDNPAKTFESCDYLILHGDGSSTAGWKTK